MTQTAEERHIEILDAFFEAHGYFRVSEPIAGQENVYIEQLLLGKAQIEAALKRFGTRGLSKRALTLLHKSLPNPAWGIEIR